MSPAGGSETSSRRDSDAAEPPVVAGSSAPVQKLRLQIERIGPHFRTVLITGETGTGKSLVARALHAASPAAYRPLIPIHGDPFEASTRAGDGPGAELGASACAEHLGASSSGETLLFEDVGDLSSSAQASLLHLLERQETLPAEQRRRILACSRENLRSKTGSGGFRQELFHRLAALTISVPPLRERKDDLRELAGFLVEQIASSCGTGTVTVAEDAIPELRQYDWPGNVRELQNVLRSAMMQCAGNTIHARDLPELCAASRLPPSEADPRPRPDRLQDVIDQHVLDVLARCDGNKLRAAELLGVSRSTLYRMLESSAALGKSR